MRAQSIVNYTEQVAGEIAVRFQDAPFDELRAWLRIAHQREAMVSELYELSALGARFAVADDDSPMSVARAVVASIWAHEVSHTRLLASLRSLSEGMPGLAELQGQLEGAIIRGASDGGVLARMLIAIGCSLGRAPEFASELRRMNTLELLRFHAELETTARMGYERIIDLTSRLQSSPEARRDFGFTLGYDMVRILSEENFHEAVFLEMSRWLNADGESFRALPARECVESLHRLARQHLSKGVVQQKLRAEHPNLESQLPGDPGQQAQWLSDGGLGQLFVQFGLDVPLVVTAP